MSDEDNHSWRNEDPSRETISAMVLAVSHPNVGADAALPAAEGTPTTAEMASTVPAKASILLNPIMNHLKAKPS